MVTIVVLVFGAIVYGYAQGYASDKLVGLGFAGAVTGLVLFGAQVTFASQPKVPCWSEMQGTAQFFRAMPFVCQDAPPARRVQAGQTSLGLLPGPEPQ